MVDYIQEGFGDHDDWTLNNSTWETLFSADDLRTGDGVSGGYGEKEYASIINNNWRFTIASATAITPNDPRGLDIQFFLNGDANPIIFRMTLDDPEGSNKFQIIYDSVVRDSHSIDESDFDFTREIYRVGSVYYYTGFNLSFDYGSIVKPVKLKLATSEGSFSTYWYNLKWWYVIEDDFCFVA